MNIFKCIIYSQKQLSSHKLRNILAILGIVIGVSMVIVMVSVGRGAKQEVEKKFKDMGSNLIIVTAGQIKGLVRSSNNAISKNAKTLILKDVEAIKKRSKNIIDISPFCYKKIQVKYEDNYIDTNIIGTTFNYQTIRNFQTTEGTFFTQNDNKLLKKVAVLGNTVKDDLFGNINPIGEKILIGRTFFEIIGILNEKGLDINGNDQDDLILIPLKTAQKRVFNLTYLNGMFIQTISEEKIKEAEDEIRKILRIEHKLNRKNKEDDFLIQNQNDLLNTKLEASDTFTSLIISIALISLLVGGIGIFAIMIISVKERTKEIGLRKAIGAQNSDILIQFITESTILGIAGGIIGVLSGIIISFCSQALTVWKTSLSINSIIISFIFSFLVGLIFGVYPARKASLLEPIEALRSE